MWRQCGVSRLRKSNHWLHEFTAFQGRFSTRPLQGLHQDDPSRVRVSAFLLARGGQLREEQALRRSSGTRRMRTVHRMCMNHSKVLSVSVCRVHTWSASLDNLHYPTRQRLPAALQRRSRSPSRGTPRRFSCHQRRSSSPPPSKLSISHSGDLTAKELLDLWKRKLKQLHGRGAKRCVIVMGVQRRSSSAFVSPKAAYTTATQQRAAHNTAQPEESLTAVHIANRRTFVRGKASSPAYRIRRGRRWRLFHLQQRVGRRPGQRPRRGMRVSHRRLRQRLRRLRRWRRAAQAALRKRRFLESFLREEGYGDPSKSEKNTTAASGDAEALLQQLLPRNEALDSAAAWTLSEHRDPRTELEFTRHLLHGLLLSLASPVSTVWDPYDVKPQVFAMDEFLGLPVFTNIDYLRLFCNKFGITVRDPSGVLWASGRAGGDTSSGFLDKSSWGRNSTEEGTSASREDEPPFGAVSEGTRGSSSFTYDAPPPYHSTPFHEQERVSALITPLLPAPATGTEVKASATEAEGSASSSPSAPLEEGEVATTTRTDGTPATTSDAMTDAVVEDKANRPGSCLSAKEPFSAWHSQLQRVEPTGTSPTISTADASPGGPLLAEAEENVSATTSQIAPPGLSLNRHATTTAASDNSSSTFTAAELLFDWMSDASTSNSLRCEKTETPKQRRRTTKGRRLCRSKKQQRHTPPTQKQKKKKSSAMPDDGGFTAASSPPKPSSSPSTDEHQQKEDGARQAAATSAAYTAKLKAIDPFDFRQVRPLPTFGLPFVRPYCIGYFGDVNTLLHNTSILSEKVDIVLNPGSPIELVLAREMTDEVLHREKFGVGLLHRAYLRVEQALRREFFAFFEAHCPEVLSARSACVPLPLKREDDDADGAAQKDKLGFLKVSNTRTKLKKKRNETSLGCRKKRRRTPSPHHPHPHAGEGEGRSSTSSPLEAQRARAWRQREALYSGGVEFELVILIDSTAEAQTFYRLQQAKAQGQLMGHYTLDIIPIRLAAPHVKEVSSVFYDAEQLQQTRRRAGAAAPSPCATKRAMETDEANWSDDRDDEDREGGNLAGFRRVGPSVSVNPVVSTDSYFSDPSNAYTEPHALFTEYLKFNRY